MEFEVHGHFPSLVFLLLLVVAVVCGIVGIVIDRIGVLASRGGLATRPEARGPLALDAVFGVKDSLVVPFKYEHPGTAPDGTPMPARWRSLTYDFGLKPLAGGPAEHRA
ncbi:hypothetical protein J0H33_16190 [bacterium]|nr:hypothetical protein [bacterium]